jgi:Mg2+-importing ATPase
MKLRAHFVARLQRRRTARHFLRHFSFELFRHASVSKAVPPDLAHTLKTAAAEDPAALLARLHSHPDGLDIRQAARVRRRRCGDNWSPTKSRCRGCTCGIAISIRSTCC